MAISTSPNLDIGIVQSFAFKVLGDITAEQMGPLSVVADRLGLFQMLATVGPVTCRQFSERASLDERYAREWLSAMACHGYLMYDRDTATFSLPPEHAFVLADPTSPFYLGSLFSMAEPYWRHIDQLAEALQRGGGIQQSDYGERFWCGLERFTATFFRNFLCQEWIPALPEVEIALRNGGSAADVGCGNGQALLTLARSFPHARLVGYDNYAPAIAAATRTADREGLNGRVRFEVRDILEGIPEMYNLITLFDVLHDMRTQWRAWRRLLAH